MIPSQPLNVDKEAVRTLVVAVGVREAARQMGLNEDTVSAWSARGKWYQKVKDAQQLAIASKPKQAIASKAPADALATVLAEHSSKTRLGLSTAAYKASKSFAKRSGDEVIESAQALRHITAAASALHGWEETKDAGITLNLGVIQGGMS